MASLLQDYRLADPKYTAFIPKNAGHAILKFRRLQEKGLAPWKYPETMIDLCKELPDDEIRKFESWMICPEGDPAPADAPFVIGEIEEEDEKKDD